MQLGLNVVIQICKEGREGERKKEGDGEGRGREEKETQSAESPRKKATH